MMESTSGTRDTILQKVSWTNQPFGRKILVVLNRTSLTRAAQCTCLAIEGTGGMQRYFGRGTFAPGEIRSAAQAATCFLSKQDREFGTNVVYWGTKNPLHYTALGYRSDQQWSNFGFPPPSAYGTCGCLKPTIQYFVEMLMGEVLSECVVEPRPSKIRKSIGIFVFLTDGLIDDFGEVRQYLVQVEQLAEKSRYQAVHIIAAGWGDQFLGDSQGQMNLLAAQFMQSEKLQFRLVVADQLSGVVDLIKAAVLAGFPVARSGKVTDERGREVCKFLDGVPGSFEFYLPFDSRRFYLHIEDKIYPVDIA